MSFHDAGILNGRHGQVRSLQSESRKVFTRVNKLMTNQSTDGEKRLGLWWNGKLQASAVDGNSVSLSCRAQTIKPLQGLSCCFEINKISSEQKISSKVRSADFAWKPGIPRPLQLFYATVNVSWPASRRCYDRKSPSRRELTNYFAIPFGRLFGRLFHNSEAGVWSTHWWTL